jgi:hypothetical protein
MAQIGNLDFELNLTHPSTMPSRKSSLPKNITDILQDSLEEFTGSKKSKRTELLDKLAEDTLPEGAKLRRHRKVCAYQSYSFNILYTLCSR